MHCVCYATSPPLVLNRPTVVIEIYIVTAHVSFMFLLLVRLGVLSLIHRCYIHNASYSCLPSLSSGPNLIRQQNIDLWSDAFWCWYAILVFPLSSGFHSERMLGHSPLNLAFPFSYWLCTLCWIVMYIHVHYDLDSYVHTCTLCWKHKTIKY